MDWHEETDGKETTSDLIKKLFRNPRWNTIRQLEALHPENGALGNPLDLAATAESWIQWAIDHHWIRLY